MQHIVVCSHEARGRGFGRALIRALEGRARAAGVETLVASVSSDETGALAFHLAVGFEVVGRLSAVGRSQDGVSVDLVLLQQRLCPTVRRTPSPVRVGPTRDSAWSI